jgi:hypothetical protein
MITIFELPFIWPGVIFKMTAGKEAAFRFTSLKFEKKIYSRRYMKISTLDENKMLI